VGKYAAAILLDSYCQPPKVNTSTDLCQSELVEHTKLIIFHISVELRQTVDIDKKNNNLKIMSNNLALTARPGETGRACPLPPKNHNANVDRKKHS